MHACPHPRWHSLIVLAGAAIVALVSARDHAGSWNDGSRLATVEALVDHGTLVIDDSIFVRPLADPQRNPYPAHLPHLRQTGTLDRLRIAGKFYSDKSPVPALFSAGQYWLLQRTTGLRAAEQPRAFCWWMNLLSGGLAYVLAVWCVFLVGRQVGLTPGWQLGLAASFGLATVAPIYAQQVNGHILGLGLTAALTLSLARLAATERLAWGWLVLAGSCAGLAYTTDLGLGPVLLLCVIPLIVWRVRRAGPVLVFLLAAAPWVALHHAVNYATGGTWKPANAVPEYFDWPGCPFSPANMTGAWQHASPGRLVVYALAMLFGKRGFFGHDLPLFLALPALGLLLRRRLQERPEVLFTATFCAGTWLLYAAASNNYSGECRTIRWFVPLLAPAYHLLALALRERPEWRKAFVCLTLAGLSLTMLGWLVGPWTSKMVPLFWPVQGLALLACLALSRRSFPLPGASDQGDFTLRRSPSPQRVGKGEREVAVS